MNFKKTIGAFLAIMLIFVLASSAVAKYRTLTLDESKSEIGEITYDMYPEPSIFEVLSPYIGIFFSCLLWITAFVALILSIRCMIKYLKG